MSENTLNDTSFTDANITRAAIRENPRPAPAGPEYDYVLSVFSKIMKDPTAAENFTQALYSISQFTETPVLILLEDIETADVMTVNATMAYYLNGINSPSTLYGVQNAIRPNFYAGRNVLS